MAHDLILTADRLAAALAGTLAAEHVPATELAAAVRTLQQPVRVLTGRRAARCGEPWPYRAGRGTAGWVVSTPEADGGLRLRFPLTDAELVAWLGGALRALPPLPLPLAELPALAPTGSALFLALADLLRAACPVPDDLSPDAPALTVATDAVRQALAGGQPGSLVHGFARLGEETSPVPDDEALDGLLALFANEGWLIAGADDTTWTVAPGLLAMLVSIAWWDLALAVTAPEGAHLRLLQGHAVWCFARGRDGRFSARVVAGAEVDALLQGLVAPVTAPAVVPAAAAPAASRGTSGCALTGIGCLILALGGVALAAVAVAVIALLAAPGGL